MGGGRMGPESGDAGARRRARALAGTGAFTGVAVAFGAVSVVFLLSAVFGPSHLQWTGQPVPATDRGGLVLYQFHGHTYTLGDPTASTFHATTVFVDPSDPATAMLDNPFNRALDVVSVLAPLALAALFFVLGLRRRRRRRRDAAAPGASFGRGLDQGTVEWLRERQRGGI